MVELFYILISMLFHNNYKFDKYPFVDMSNLMNLLLVVHEVSNLENHSLRYNLYHHI